MRKILLTVSFIGLAAASFLPSAASAVEGCAWRNKTWERGSADSPSKTIDGCAAEGGVESDESKCDAATKPAAKSYLDGARTTTPECCCFANLTTKKCYWQKEAGHALIGGVVDIVCNAGFSITSDTSKCTEAKPNDGLYYGCCCEETQTATLTTDTETPKFTMPDWQIKLPTVKLTEPKCTINDDGSYQCEIPWLGQYLLGIYNYGLSIAGILAAIVLMAGGIMWLISGGDASKVGQAKELIIGSITGLIILFSSYIILTQINPDLVKFKAITIGTIKEKQSALAVGRHSTTLEEYKNMACASDAELEKGIEFYATGYYKPKWEDTDNFRCVVAMQCSCPLGVDTSKNCDDLYGKTFPGYHPCNAFPEGTPYCNMTASGGEPKDGDIAGPINCKDNLPYGTQVCFRGETYTITDTGGGIQGRRIDVWSGDNLDKAMSVTGTGILTKGACK